jgi:immune inhibitor A
VAAADPLVDSSQYDNNGDGYVDNLIVVHAGRGAEVTGSASDIWSHKWQTHTSVAVDGA